MKSSAMLRRRAKSPRTCTARCVRRNGNTYAQDIIREVARRGNRSHEYVNSRAFTADALDMDYTPVGSGKDRVVFANENNTWVVKFARGARGARANQDEADRWARADARTRKWLLPVLVVDPDGEWLVMAAASDEALDMRWFRSFSDWWSANGRDKPTMPPRKLVYAMEHASDPEDWLMLRGHPVLFDYS